MENLLRLEEVGLFALTIYLFSLLEYSWWLFPLLLFVPDISILGYMRSDVTGAYIYNFLHHRGIAILLYLTGVLLGAPVLALIGLVIFAHSSLDRIFGYGMKHTTGFRDTHLGNIGKGD
jgi:hypothetical protein